jgi:transcriptional regulator with XRE-family HTH domain
VSGSQAAATNESERLLALADFLRTRRARLAPSDVGLPDGFRRRAPGLRREEVAQLANIGVSWYTSLEQGRDVRASDQVLDSLARALQLNADERRHLFTLAQQHMPALPPPEQPLDAALQQLVQALDPNPAYVLGRRWDALAWNRAADLVFDFGTIKPPHSRNLVWRMFTTPALQQGLADGRRIAQGLVAQFRADSARYPGDPWFAELIDDLLEISDAFRELWAQHDVLSVPSCHKQIEHATLGYLEFEMATLQHATQADTKVITWMASPATAAKLGEQLGRSE